jgi:tetraacyldisaccharide 4'-kinase
LAAAASADALIVDGLRPAGDGRLKEVLGVGTAFYIERTIGRPRALSSGEPVPISTADVILAVAGIARPDRFFADLEAAGLPARAKLVFRDHHPYTDADIVRIVRAARDASATIVLTTEKDAVRLSGRRLGDLRLAVVPLTATIQPASFVDWLLGRIQRTRHLASGTRHPRS